MNLDDILDLLGGDPAVARLLGCGIPAISNWKVRGIPPRRILDLFSLTQQRGLGVTLEQIEGVNRAIKAARVAA